MVPSPFTMWVGEHEGVLAVRLVGRLEAPVADDVHRQVIRRSPAVVSLDLSGLTSIDDAGFAALVGIRQAVVAGGGYAVVRNTNPAVEARFAAAGLDALLHDERAPLEPAATIARLEPLNEKGGRDARRSHVPAPPKVA